MIHQYKLNGYNIVLDVFSGSVHCVDDLAYDVIEMYENSDKENIIKAMLEKYKDNPEITAEEISDCYDDVTELKDNGKLFTADKYEDLAFAVPKSGTNLFVDAMCIPSGSKQKEAAEMYINFMCEPDIAYATTTYVGYSTPNTAAYDMLDDEIKNDGISYPDDEYLKENTTVFYNLSDEANQKMQDLWTDMKSSQYEAKNVWLVPAFMLICVAVSIVILIRRHIKNKKDIF